MKDYYEKNRTTVENYGKNDRGKVESKREKKTILMKQNYKTDDDTRLGEDFNQFATETLNTIRTKSKHIPHYPITHHTENTEHQH